MRHTSKTSHSPHASHSVPLGTCSLNCCLHRACRLHAHYLLLASKKPHSELYEIFIHCVHFSSLFPSFFLFPTLAPSPLFKKFFLAPPPNRRERLLPCFSARLPSCPEALEYLVSSNISPLSARSKNLIGKGNKEKKGGTTSRSLVGESLHRARWET